MTSRYILSPEAARDIEQVRDYYLDEAGAQVARHVLAQITKALRFLATTPGAGHRRDDLTDEAVRFWPVLSYLIAYDPAMRPIGIARVLHAGRDLEALFHRSPPRM
ncbi:type II toxin-antitoxin system RelE/ParE family toxin [Novosphingobium sp. ERN07]|uniref:type II toxin-antitoxin system RelE/ParE family toxin n=1 Tax=Novosphingobium sp. ERN07 TaxID=2726187 RepID=UPI001457462B|nr:type II toxin-antitoxin system RelE/ParE family toxin [Novosphingobium sp. ERN07]